MADATRYFFRLDVFLRAVIKDHINRFGRSGQIKLRFELTGGLREDGILDYQGSGGLMRCSTVSSIRFDAAVMSRHRSVTSFAHGETIQKPFDPKRNLFVAAWYDILTLELDHLPPDYLLGAALREANKVQPVRIHVRFK
jgi:hypothetical protein